VPELIAGLVLVGLLAAVPTAIIALDIRSDRRRTVTVNVRTPLYAEPRLDCGRREPAAIAFVSPGDRVKVLRVRYGKDCQTVKVAIGDGGVGWLFDDGVAVTVSPP
jgi:hypothetical protein